MKKTYRTRPPEERFWSRVTKTDSCWLWDHTDRKGYGVFYDGKRRLGAHVYSWQLAHNRLRRKGYEIMHLCNRPTCVNPAHLIEGTHRDNMLHRSLCGRTGGARLLATRIAERDAYLAESARLRNEAEAFRKRVYAGKPLPARLP